MKQLKQRLIRMWPFKSAEDKRAELLAHRASVAVLEKQIAEREKAQKENKRKEHESRLNYLISLAKENKILKFNYDGLNIEFHPHAFATKVDESSLSMDEIMTKVKKQIEEEGNENLFWSA